MQEGRSVAKRSSQEAEGTMSVRFAPAPRVVEYDLDERERRLKRQGSSQLNVEYQREKKLYSLVLRWKTENPTSTVDGGVDGLAELSVDDVLGAVRGEQARKLLQLRKGESAHMESLLGGVSDYVLDSWPTCEINGDEEYVLTSMVVLRLVAEFLCKYFRFELHIKAEQDSLYSATFHIVQYVLATHFR